MRLPRAHREIAASLGWGLIAFLASMVLSALAGLLKPAQAATYWVSPTGNAANSGADSTTNAKTLAWFNANAVAGDVCRFKSGTYSSPIQPAANGTSGNRIRYYGFSADPYAVTVTDIRFGWNGSNSRGDYSTARWFHVSGDMTGCDEAATLHAVGDSLTHIMAPNCVNGLTFRTKGSVLADSRITGGNVTSSGQSRWLNMESVNAGMFSTSNFLARNVFEVEVNTTASQGDVQILNLTRAAYNHFYRNKWDITVTACFGYFFPIEMYRSYYNLFQEDTLDVAMNATPGGTTAFYSYRDTSSYNRMVGSVLSGTGTGAAKLAMGLSNSGSAPGSTQRNSLWGNIITTDGSFYGGALYWQNGVRNDTVAFNVVRSPNKVVYVNSGTECTGLVMRHNTFYAQVAQVVDLDDVSASASGKLVGNIYYTSAANGATALVSVDSGVELDSSGTYFSRGGTSSNAVSYNGSAGAPGAGGGLGVSGKAVWGSPVFVDSTYATFDAGISQTGYADNVKAPSLQDGFSGAFSDSMGGSTGTSDVDPPSAVSDLAIAGESQTAFDLEWTSPDGNGDGTGQAALYDIRYSTSTINEGNWSSATQLTGEPTPQAFDNLENWTTGDVFSPSTTYYLALKSQDDAGNWSALSNVASGATDAVPDSVVALRIVTKDDVAGVTFDYASDPDSNATVHVLYGVNAATDTAHVPARRPGSARTYATSLFGLTPETTYVLAIVTSDGARQETTLTTRRADWWRRTQTGPSVYASPAGLDVNDGLSTGSPKRTIAAAWAALLARPNQGRGGGVLLMDGVFYERVTLSGSSGTPDSGYFLKAVNPGAAIIDGADERLVNGSSTLTWSAVNAANDPARVGGAYATGDTLFRAHYAAADSLEGLAEGGYKYHHCASLAEIWNKTGTGTAGAYDLSATTVGFVYINASADSIYVRARGGTQVRTSAKAFGYRHSLLWITDPYVQVEGVVFRNAGGLPTLNGKAVRFGGGGASGNNGTVFGCTFESNDMEGVHGINAFGGADSLTVASCTFSAGYTERLGYEAGKGRREEYRQFTQLDGTYNTIEGNTVRYAFNGIGQAGIVGSLTAGADLDVTGNTVSHISDDALEVEIGCGVNQRIVGNDLSRFGNGLSQTPVVIGPSFVVRNLFRYPKSGGGAFKLGGGSTAQGFYYHNTTAIDTTRASAGVYAAGGQFWHKTFINNVLTGKLGSWPGVRSTLTGADTTGAITNAFNWNVVYAPSDTIVYWKNAALDTAAWKLRGQEHNGRMRYHPAWQDTASGHWASVRGIDGGRRIAGITGPLVTAYGAAPDVGAFEADVVAPTTIADLAVVGTGVTRAALTWSAPVDAPANVPAVAYDLRYSTSPIDSGNWAAATQVSGEPAPAPAGALQSFTVTGLSTSTTYYFAMRALDLVGNLSTISNNDDGLTRRPPEEK